MCIRLNFLIYRWKLGIVCLHLMKMAFLQIHPLKIGRHTWHCPYLSHATWISVTQLSAQGLVHLSTERHFLRSLSTNVQGIALIHDGSNVRIMVGAGQILTSTVDPPRSGGLVTWSLVTFFWGKKTRWIQLRHPSACYTPIGWGESRPRICSAQGKRDP